MEHRLKRIPNLPLRARRARGETRPADQAVQALSIHTTML